MRMIYKLIPTALLISSCVHFPIVERCFTSTYFNACVCSDYDINKGQKVGEGYAKELKYCDEYGGFHRDTWAKTITPKLRDRYRRNGGK